MKPEKLSFKRFYHNLDKILVLFFMVFMMMEYAWIPFNSYAAEYLLKQTGYLFLSYNNAWAVLSSNWLVGLGFLVLVVVNLFVARENALYRTLYGLSFSLLAPSFENLLSQ